MITKKKPRNMRAVALVVEVRNLLREIDADTILLEENLNEIDELAGDLDDPLLCRVWESVSPVFEALDGKANRTVVDSAIRNYLRKKP